MTKIIWNRKTGRTIIEDENLSIKELVEKAVREGISLQYAFLSAFLRDVNPIFANLRDINLRNVDLRGSNLRNADLRGANLENCNLQDANLDNVDLRNADLTGVKINQNQLANLIKTLKIEIINKKENDNT